ncbi:MAG: 5'-3' exonuclease H3TH domain-containing protein [Polyangiaceae bacterium]
MAKPPPKIRSLSGEDVILEDSPALGRDLFLIDGNNLAYRAFFALPEGLATSTGFPTNALLGFANMMLKLVIDYRPRGVAVAWDTRPTVRLEEHAEYKGSRRAMPDKLSQQFPHFRPLVDAFGYPSFSVQGWEADDIVATLATQAEAAGLTSCVVSTDRDALQLVSDRTCVMMTPRGVSDVVVYTVDRVVARYGIKPDQITDFVALKGDSSDNLPAVPGIGEKTAAQLVARYGSLESILEHATDEPPSRAKALREHADQARLAKRLATTRRDLPLGCDVAALAAHAPDRSALAPFFERFEFKKLVPRIPLLERSRRGSSEAGDGGRPS